MERNVRLRVIGRPHGVPAPRAARHRSRRARDARQHRADAAHGLQLRRPRRAARRLPRRWPGRCRRASSTPEDISRGRRQRRALHRRRARSRSPDPHQRRDAHLELPAVADRLHRAVDHARPSGRTSAPPTSTARSPTSRGARADSAGCDVADAAAESSPSRARGRRWLKRVASAVVLLPVFLLIVVEAPAWMFKRSSWSRRAPPRCGS